MQRVKTSTAVTSREAYTTDGTPGYFTAGNAVAGTPATVPGAQWFNQVQEEILNAIKAAGIAPDPAKDNQLAAAIAELIAANTVTVSAASETAQGIVELATVAEATTGTDTARAVTPAGVKAVADTKVGLPLFAAAWDVIVGNGVGAAIKKTFAEFWAYLITFSVGAWTKQQYTAPVNLGSLSTALTLNSDNQCAAYGTIAASITLNAPTTAVRGKTLLLTLTAGGTYTLTWDAAFTGTDDCILPTLLISGKRYYMQFYYDGEAWVLFGLTTR